VAFQCCEDLTSLVVFTFADEETRAVGEEGTQGPDAEGEEDLECQRESPGNVAWSEGEAEGEPICNQYASTVIKDVYTFEISPVADAESRDAVCHLNDDELATALHLARFTLPDLCDGSLSVERAV
jgi:hypothetical protein